MKRIVSNILGGVFLIALLIFSAYMLVPFVRYLSVPLTGGTAAPNFSESPEVVKMKAQNKNNYFNTHVMGNNQVIVKNINEVPEQGGWLNTAPLDLHALAAEDKLILIDFWAYSNLASYQSLPYVESLWQRYKGYGLVVVGVHSPKFDFEKKPVNILNAIHADGITYPVVTDGKKEIWKKFSNDFLPAQYLIDPYGKIVYTHFGERDPVREEQMIRDQLAMYGWELPPVLNNTIANTQAQQASLGQAVTFYLGTDLMRRRLGNDAQPILDRTTLYVLPKVIQPDRLYLTGQWKAKQQYLELMTEGQVVLSYQANNVSVVLAPALKPIWVEVELDGAPVPVALRGKSIVEKEGKTYMQVVQPGLYFPISDKTAARHSLVLSSPAGVRVYTLSVQ